MACYLVTMQTFDAPQIRLTIEVIPTASDAPFRLVGATTATLEIRSRNLRTGEVSTATHRLLAPIIVTGRARPKPRRNARGGLRRMVKTRRMTVTTVDELRRRNPDWPGWGPGIVARLAPASGGMMGKTAFVDRFAADLVARTQFTTATGSDLDDIGEMFGLPRRDT